MMAVVLGVHGDPPPRRGRPAAGRDAGVAAATSRTGTSSSPTSRTSTSSAGRRCSCTCGRWPSRSSSTCSGRRSWPPASRSSAAGACWSGCSPGSSAPPSSPGSSASPSPTPRGSTTAPTRGPCACSPASRSRSSGRPAGLRPLTERRPPHRARGGRDRRRRWSLGAGAHPPRRARRGALQGRLPLGGARDRRARGRRRAPLVADRQGASAWRRWCGSACAATGSTSGTGRSSC